MSPATATVNPNKKLWKKGDFSKLAATMRASSDALVESLGVTPGRRVPDLACGDGATRCPLARRGAKGPGIDIARNLLAAAQVRVAAEELRGKLTELIACENRAGDNRTEIAGRYLRVTVRVPQV